MEMHPTNPWLMHQPPGRIAIVRALRLGDLLCAVPMLRAIRLRWPDAEITLIGLPWANALVERFPHYLDGFVEFPGWPGIPERAFDPEAWAGFLASVQGRAFDLAIQAHGNGSHINDFVLHIDAGAHAGFHPAAEPAPSPGFIAYPADRPEPLRLLALAAHLGAAELDPRLEFPLREADHAEAGRLRAELGVGVRPYACLHAGASVAERRWSAVGFARVADALASAGLVVILLGTDDEVDIARDVQRSSRYRLASAVGRTSLGGLAALVAGAELLVVNDTSVSHLAAALEVPSVVVFSGSDPARWAPLDGRRHRPVGTGRPDLQSERAGKLEGAQLLESGPPHEAVLGAVTEQLAVRAGAQP